MMEYLVNGISLNYEAIGEKHRGQPIVLLHNAIDLTANTSWRQEGFCVEKLFDNELYAQFRDNTEQLLRNLWKKATLNFPANEPLENYHQAIESKEQHLAAVELTKLISVDDFSIDIKLYTDKQSKV